MIRHRYAGMAGFIGFGVMVILSACSTAPAPVTKSYKHSTYEMRSAITRPIYPTGDQNIAWIDDERVLFEGLDRKLRDPVDTNRAGAASAEGFRKV